jgi:3-oxoacyl-[acyl-carrier protein] reductase
VSPQPWGADDLDEVYAELAAALTPGARWGEFGADLADPDSIPRLVTAATSLTGGLDILVCNHARSGRDGSIFDVTAEMLDGHWSVNARSTLLLTRAFAEQFSGFTSSNGLRPGEQVERQENIDELNTGRVVWMTSGQLDGPLRGEVAYAASKAALAGLTPTVASELLARGIILNTVNPGPVNTGYLDEATSDRPLDEISAAMRETAFGRFGLPDDPARLIGWLVSPEGRWMVGQVLTSDGGFRL